MKLLIAFILYMSMGVWLSSCGETDYAVRQFRDIHEVVVATQDTQHPLAPEQALFVIDKVATTSADKLDPEKKIAPVTTGSVIAANPQPELQKIIDTANAGPVPSGWLNWTTILGVGALALGTLGTVFGGPMGPLIGGTVKILAQRFIPNYEQTKTAAVGVIASLDSTLTDFSAILEAAPETKKALQDKLGGQDPVQWFKDKMNAAQTDMGSHTQVAAIMNIMKSEMTTKNGVLAPTIAEFDHVISKKV